MVGVSMGPVSVGVAVVVAVGATSVGVTVGVWVDVAVGSAFTGWKVFQALQRPPVAAARHL